jgi:hypothetical protein
VPCVRQIGDMRWTDSSYDGPPIRQTCPGGFASSGCLKQWSKAAKHNTKLHRTRMLDTKGSNMLHTILVTRHHKQHRAKHTPGFPGTNRNTMQQHIRGTHTMSPGL